MLVQSTSGWCSPAIANVKGNVTIKCIGVSPEALEILNKRLLSSNLKAQERLVEANRWAARYHKLLDELNGSTDADSVQLRQLIEQGKFQSAERILRSSIERRTHDLNVLQRSLASEHARLADVFYLDRKIPEATEQFRQAYLLSGDDPEYALSYGGMLAVQHKFDSAADLAQNTVNLITKKSTPLSEKEEFQLYQALNELAACHDSRNRIEDALATSEKALTVITALATVNAKYENDYLDAVVATAELQSRVNHVNSIKLLEQVHPRVDQLSASKDTIHQRAKFYNALGLAYLFAEDYLDAEEPLEKARDFYAQAYRANADVAAGYGYALTNLANCERFLKKYDLAEAGFAEAAGIFEELVKLMPWYMGSLADVYSGWGELYEDNHQFGKAERKLSDAVRAERVLASQEPTPEELYGFAQNLLTLQRIYRAEGKDFDRSQINEAEEILTKCNSHVCLVHETSLEANIGALYFDNQDWGEAKQHYIKARKAARAGLDFADDSSVGLYLFSLARFIHDLEDTKGLFCYKHVAETMFAIAKEASRVRR